VHRLISLQVPGIAILTSQIDPTIMDLLVGKNICAVYLDLGRVERLISNIVIEYENGIGEALDHLRDLGHERIGFIGGPPQLPSAQRRRRAFAAAAKAAAVDALAVDADFSVKGGYFACAKLFAQVRPTAILAANDLMAIGSMHCAHDRGLDVPRDVSIVGFDDITFGDRRLVCSHSRRSGRCSPTRNRRVPARSIAFRPAWSSAPRPPARHPEPILDRRAPRLVQEGILLSV
jgi:LacI family transcriptional regulator